MLIATLNLVWNAQHSWAQFRMAAVLSAEQGGPFGALAHLPLLVALAGPLLGLWILGVRWLGSAAGRDHRWVLVVAVTAVVVFTARGGKSYYPAPALIGLFAAGAMLVEARTARAGTPATRWRWLAAITASFPGVSDETWAAARKHHDDDQLAALVCVIAMINAGNRMNVIVGNPGGSYRRGMFADFGKGPPVPRLPESGGRGGGAPVTCS